MHCVRVFPFLLGGVFLSFSLSSAPLFSSGKQEFLVSYYDHSAYDEQGRKWFSSNPNINTTGVERGMLLLYQRSLGEPAGLVCMFGGVNLGRWSFPGEQVYTYSSFFSSRFWGFSFLGIRPYLEISLGGPTFISRSVVSGIDFGSNFIFQHYAAVGVKLFSLSVDFRVIRYAKDLKGGVTMPLIGSVGVGF